MKLELTDDQALVFFEWIGRLDERDAFPVEDPAEEHVLWCLHGQLEKALSEPFRADYRQLVKQARARVRASSAQAERPFNSSRKNTMHMNLREAHEARALTVHVAARKVVSVGVRGDL
jgi:hypothetical protein